MMLCDARIVLTPCSFVCFLKEVPVRAFRWAHFDQRTPAEEMGDDAILSPAQEEAGLKAREISKQESAVVDKSQQLVNDLWLTFSLNSQGW